MRRRPRLRAVALEGGLAVAVAGLWWTGRVLPVPSVGSWASASGWYEEVGPAVAFVAVLRLLAMGVGVWLLVAVVGQLLACRAPGSGGGRLASAIAPRSLQRFVQGLVGVSLTAGLAATAPGAGILDQPTEGVAVLRLADEPSGGTASIRLLDGPPVAQAPPAEPAPIGPAPGEPTPSGQQVVVEPGHSLWSIAEGVLVEWGEPHPSDAAVAAYWRLLVDANRGNLVDPSNADLIYAGQTVMLVPWAP